VSDYLQERLDDAFPSSADAQLARAVQQGVLLADGVVENERWLRNLLSKDVRGYLRRAAILARVHEACVAGDLPFASTLERMPRGPFHWVEVSSGGMKAHVCRTEAPSAFPEDTPTRQDERLSNQIGLFDNVVPLKEVAANINHLFAWLTFGVADAGQLGHLCWAMPASDGKSWLAHTNVLFRLAVAKVEVEPEAPTERAILKFRDQISESVEKSDEKSTRDQ